MRRNHRNYLLIALILGWMGAFFWAIRGTGGFGGETGGALAGLGWATLWLGLSQLLGDADRRPYGNGKAFAAITFGIAIGGFTGYGVYIAWINGQYQMNHKLHREIAPWTGYAMLFLCGLHWGGVTGALLSWCAPTKPIGWIGWIGRIVSGVVGATLAVRMVQWFPEWFLPFYSEGYYQNEEYVTSIRALRSAPNVMQHVGLFLGFFLFEIARRDWRAVKLMLVMSLGFAIPFAIGGHWHTLHKISDLQISWWKNWEMTIGMGGGLAFGLAFYLFNRPTEAVSIRETTKSERIFGIGLTIWLAGREVILGTYDGVIRSGRFEVSLDATRHYASWAYVLIATMCGAAWIYRTLTMDRQRLAHQPPISIGALAAIIGMIIVAGYVTSVPLEMRLANHVLLVVYTFAIGISGVILCLLLKRPSRTADESRW